MTAFSFNDKLRKKTCHHKEKLHTEHVNKGIKQSVEWIGLMLTHHPDPLILHEKNGYMQHQSKSMATERTRSNP